MSDLRAPLTLRTDPAFQELERSRAGLSWSLAILMLAIYFGFTLLVAFAPAVAARPVYGEITLGFALGLGVILAAIVLTGIYVVVANSWLDPMIRRLSGAAR
jgi:uncharacterized membrane protein (DUF485 family)